MRPTHTRDSNPWDDALRPRLRLDEVVTRGAERWPENPAIIDETGRRSYSQLESDIDRLRSALRAGGVERGDRVVVAVSMGRIGITLLYALSRLGATAVPVNDFWTAHEVEDVIRRSECEYVLMDGPLARADKPVPTALAQLAPTHGRASAVIRDVDEIEWATGARRDVQQSRDEDEVALLLFTSGSTAAPKGALVTHEGLVGVAHYIGLASELAESDRFIAVMPIYHVGGISDGFLPIHLVGGACLPIRFDGPRVLALFESEGATCICGFDSMLDALRNSPGYSPAQHASWQTALISGGEQTYDSLRAAGVRRIVSGIGMTECSCDIATTRMTQPEAERRAGHWLILPGLDVRIADPATGAERAAGEVGEIRIKGWSLFRGYIDGSTGLDEDGYFCSGDLGCMLPNNALSFEGRIKEMIKSGGENVAAFEVEEFLRTNIGAIREAVVVGVPDERWGEMVVAFAEFEVGSELTQGEIRELASSKLAPFKIPKLIFPVAPGSWPLMAAGKIDRPRLRELARSRASAADA